MEIERCDRKGGGKAASFSFAVIVRFLRRS